MERLRNATLAWAITALCVLAVIVLAIVLITSGGDDDDASTAGSTAQPARLVDLARDPQPFEDRRIVVSGQIREVLADQRTFLLGPSGILVTAPPPIEVQEGDVAQVAGTLRRLDEDSLRDRLPAVAQPRIEEFGGRPLLLATEVETVDVAAPRRAVTLDEVVGDPQTFLRSEVTLEGVTVSDVLTDRVAVVDGEGLIVGATGGLGVAEGDRVEVTGRALEASPEAVAEALGNEQAASAIRLALETLDLGDYGVLIVADEVAPA